MVAPTYLSPGIGNLRIGRGYMQMKLQGESVYLDMGNCTMAEFLVKPTIEPHYSSRVGVRKKDFVTPTQLDGTLTMSLEEITARNMAIAMLGTPSESGAVEIDAYTNPLIYASILFTDTSVAGPQWNIEFPLVVLTPAKAVSLIAQGSGTWSTIDLQADILQDTVTGQFFVARSSSFT